MKYPNLSIKNNVRVEKFKEVETLLLNSLVKDNKKNMEKVVNALEFVKHEREKIINRGFRD